MNIFPYTFKPLFTESQAAKTLKENQNLIYHNFIMYLRWKSQKEKIIETNFISSINQMFREMAYYRTLIIQNSQQIEFWCREAVRYDMEMMSL